MPKAKHCDECKFHRFCGVQLTCAAGHKPRFYKPREDLGYTAPDDWGWKRRCEDFEPIK